MYKAIHLNRKSPFNILNILDHAIIAPIHTIQFKNVMRLVFNYFKRLFLTTHCSQTIFYDFPIVEAML